MQSPVRRAPSTRSPKRPSRQERAERPPVGIPVESAFFDRDPQEVAVGLLGLVLCHRVRGSWLMASLVETEAYYLEDKASHASLGFTESRRALFMPAGTIYMYYARGGDSFNVSVRGEGNAVLFKAGWPLMAEHANSFPSREGPNPNWSSVHAAAMLEHMARLNPLPSGARRPVHRLCAGQTLLCRALDLRVPVWNTRTLPGPGLLLVDVGYRPSRIVRTRRLGIPAHRDPHFLYRFVDLDRSSAATRPPLLRGARETLDYEWVTLP